MKRLLRSSLVVVILVMMLLSLTSCAKKDNPPAANAPKIIRIGVLGPMTGLDAWFGDEIKVAIDLQLSKIDYKIGDYSIELVYIDSESDAEKAAIAYEKAIVNDKITVGFMDWCAWVSTACMEIAAKYKIPHFFSFGTEEAIDAKIKADFDTYKYWVGKAWPDPRLLTEAYVEAVTGADWTPRNKTFAVVCDDSSWGRDFGDAIASQFLAAGWTKASEDWVPYGETDFAPLIGRLKASDAALVCGTITDPASVTSYIKQARDANLQSVIIADGLGWAGEWYSMTGAASDYIFDQIPQWTTAEAKKFAEDFEAKAGFAPSPSAAGMCYDWTGFLIDVFNKTLSEYGEITSATLMKCAENWVIPGKLTYTRGIIHKEYKYTTETFPNPVVSQDHYIFPVIQYFDGEGKIVWPANWADQAAIIPDFMR